MEKLVVQYLNILGSRNFYEDGEVDRCLPAKFTTCYMVYFNNLSTRFQKLSILKIYYLLPGHGGFDAQCVSRSKEFHKTKFLLI